MRGWIVVVLAGCGRVGFESGGAIDAATDGAIDAAIDDAAQALPCPPRAGQLFCESFEGTSALSFATGAVTSTDLRAYRGARSQHAQTIGANEASWQIGQVLPFVTSGDLYARWYVFVPASVADVQLSSVHLVEDDLPYHGVIHGFRDAVAEVTSSEANMTLLSSHVVPRDRWVCAQMHVAISDTAGSIDGGLDGQTFGSLDDIDTLPAAGFRNVHSGLYATGFSTGPSEIWIDELAVGTLPIPCD